MEPRSVYRVLYWGIVPLELHKELQLSTFDQTTFHEHEGGSKHRYVLLLTSEAASGKTHTPFSFKYFKPILTHQLSNCCCFFVSIEHAHRVTG
jgi:hypothetical protein